MIELHHHSGKSFYINPHRVESLHENESGMTTIVMAGGEATYHCTEGLAQLIPVLRRALYLANTHIDPNTFVGVPANPAGGGVGGMGAKETREEPPLERTSHANPRGAFFGGS